MHLNVTSPELAEFNGELLLNAILSYIWYLEKVILYVT